MDSYIRNRYNLWLENAVDDIDIIKELEIMKKDDKKIEDAFYKDLSFGTGGLRGIIGAGTNRVNIYTIAKATQGLANYILKNVKQYEKQVAIGYDSRIKSELFAKTTACVLAANGIKSYIYPRLMPVPCLSYATRYLSCSMGVMITASHNPAQYNGYKVYDEDGCQITTHVADIILNEIEKVNLFQNVKQLSFENAVKNHLIEYIDDDVYTSYLNEVKKQSILENIEIDKNISIVYTPLNGAGRDPVINVLTEMGYSNITLVKEQEFPDGYFPTCSSPNPEDANAMTLGIEYCKQIDAELLLATDPDCDRVGIAIKNNIGNYILLSGNETGVLLLNYILERLKLTNSMPSKPKIYKTIVTTDMAEVIARNYGVDTVNTLTGFKYIGEQIGFLEKMRNISSFIFGMEESCGYLRGVFVRDKDGVVSSMLICEMYCYYKSQGISLYDKLMNLYKVYGYYFENQHSYKFEGINGISNIEKIMNYFRGSSFTVNNKRIIKGYDYSVGINGLPKSNVLKYFFEDNCSIVIRPSGTESKLKIYITAKGSSREESSKIERKMYNEIDAIIKNIIEN